MSSRRNSEHSAGLRAQEGGWVGMSGSRRCWKLMYRVANRRNGEAGHGSKSEAGYQDITDEAGSRNSGMLSNVLRLYYSERCFP